MEAHGYGSFDALLDRSEVALGIATDRIHALRQCISDCRCGGTVSLSGVYGGFLNHLNLGAAFQKGLTIRMGQCNVMNYMEKLLHMIAEGEIDPSFVITHRVALDDAPRMYETFKKKEDGCIKVVMKPNAR
jgi:threonine dehydrogenase-like Zn-dependent dehydrogenase